MNSKKIFVLLVICVVVCMQAVAQNASCSGSEKPFVSVSKKAIENNTQYFEIYAESIGTGPTFEAAKADAYNKLLPEILANAQNIGKVILARTQSKDLITENGIEEIIANALISATWEMKDGVYCYTLRLVFKSPELVE